MKAFAPALTIFAVVAPACSADEGGEPADTGVADTGTLPDTAPDGAPPGDTGLCTPGERFCVSPVESGVCNDAGDGAAAVTECEGASACEPLTGVCRGAICRPDTTQCLSLRKIQTCAETGGGWSEPENCPEGEFCADGQCRSCQADKIECLSGTSYRQCASDSSGWSEETACQGEDQCIAGKGCVGCDLTTECLSDQQMRRYCANPAIDFEETIDCLAGQSCTEGACIACPADAVECLGETTYRQCSPSGDTWSEERPCDADQVCFDDACIPYACVPRVLLLVDKSGSMGSHWDAVKRSIMALASANPKIRFGLLTFPSTSGFGCEVDPTPQIDFEQNNTVGFERWFDLNSPNGGTPLVAGVQAVTEAADPLFHALGGALIVLSDGQDGCFPGDGEKEALAVAASTLFLNHDVVSYAIGYTFSGDTGELDTIATNGGSGVGGYILAGDEDELLGAFTTIVNDLKACDP